MIYDKHEKLHVNTESLHPYKCHLCGKIFDLKDNVKQHYLQDHLKVQNLQNTVVQINSPIKTIVPQQTDYSCTNCNINFTSDQDYRNHICSNGKKTNITCNINSDIKKIISVPNPLTGSQIGILQAVKFSCRVCSKEFDNVKEVDLHTRTHLEVSEDDLKCNICKKYFKSSAIFTEHLKHHLQHAYVCPICSKAFINRVSLNNHNLKMHTKVVE
ncbi:PREDICTED: zinc finger protein 879-like isoform X1 [Cyphomyrmex costatus]|nr:PREDICTED: zinc finger protein 879-like isoform X1 [Cyphomyrmex costatus]